MLHSSRAFGFQRGWHSLCSWVGLASSSRDHHCRPAPTKTPGTRWELVDLSTSPRSAADNRKLCDNSKQHTPAVFLLTDTFLFVSLSFVAVQPPKPLLHFSLSPSLQTCRPHPSRHARSRSSQPRSASRAIVTPHQPLCYTVRMEAVATSLHLHNRSTGLPVLLANDAAAAL